MKRFTKWCLILAGFCGAVGLVMILCASMLGASLVDMLRNNEFAIYKSASGWHGSWENTYSETVSDDETYADSAAQAMVDASEVKKLEIDVDSAEIIFMTDSEENQICVQSIGEYETFVTEVRGDTLKIKEGDEEVFSVLGWNGKRTIEIYIPEGFVFDEVTMEMDAGSIEGYSLNVSGRLKIEVDAGSVELSEVTMGQLDVETDAGSVALYDCVLRGDARIASDVGSAELYLECDEADFNYQVECDMGSVIINEKEWSGIDKSIRIANKAKYTINIECDMGSIEIYTS